MSTQPFEPKATHHPPNLVQIGIPIEDVIQQRLAEERARLEREAGVQPSARLHHFKTPVEQPFTKERARPHHAAVRRPDLEA